MKERIANFWRDPVNKFWTFSALISSFLLIYGILRLYRQDLNDILSLLLIIIAFIIELIIFAAMIINSFNDTKKDYLELFQLINRDIRYRYYLKKNKDKQYKGPSWKDDIFEKITDTKQRVDAYVKASIEFQQADFEAWKRKNIGINLDSRDHTITRSFLIICAAIVSFLLLLGLLTWLGFDSAKITELIENSKGTVLLGIFTTFIGSPVIFIVWLFRDKNNRVQIENARKDTNLKDFQKLSEWASGFHLPEIKQTISTKTTEKTKGTELEETNAENLHSREDFLAPENSNSISRRQGAEALQASAIAQLEAFMFGKYGEQFMQPAFLLVHSIWESVINQHLNRQENQRNFIRELYTLQKTQIISVLNKALIDNQGFHLRLFEKKLLDINLIGLSSEVNSLNPLSLAGCNIQGIILSHGNLKDTSLAGAKIKFSKLHYTNLTSANLCEADFYFSDLKGADLSSALLIGANLTSTNLNVTNLNKTNLSWANLSNASLTGATLTETFFTSSIINSFTMFGLYENNIHQQDEIREDVLSRGAIWDDDPEWLVGKIQDTALLEKIRQDCAKRAERAKEKGA